MRRIEKTLLFVLGTLALLLLFPSLNYFDTDSNIKEAKKQGTYYAIHATKQTFFGKRVSLDGVIYKDGELKVYMSSTGLFSSPNLPNKIQVRTDSNEVLEHSSSYVFSSLLVEKGRFTLRNVPEDLKSITVFRDSYGESFAFPVSFEREGANK